MEVKDLDSRENTPKQRELSEEDAFLKEYSEDYSFVSHPARVAFYDDLLSAPRITEIEPAPTNEFIENLASTVYEQSRKANGRIAYTAIREVAENCIHAHFEEVIVSILDNGNTIRFADQGPGISDAEKAMLPGFTSATEPMKHYIRGVGSGLPITAEYIQASHGAITIEDNINGGSVVTLSLVPYDSLAQPRHSRSAHKERILLSKREQDVLATLANEGPLGVTEIARLASIPQSSTHVLLEKLEGLAYIEKTPDKKRRLTESGFQISNSLIS